MELATANERLIKCKGVSQARDIDTQTVAFGDFDGQYEDYYLLDIKARLMAFVWDRIQEQNLTQTEAATKLNVSQGRISNLKNIKHDKFSIDMLITMSYRLGHKFELYSVDV